MKSSKIAQTLLLCTAAVAAVFFLGIVVSICVAGASGQSEEMSPAQELPLFASEEPEEGEALSFPIHQFGDGKALTIYGVLPKEIPVGKLLFFRTSGYDVEVFVGGKHIYTGNHSRETGMFSIPTARWNLVPLPSQEDGEPFEIRLTPFERTDLCGSVFYGTSENYMMALAIESVPQFVLGTCLVVFGCFAFITCFYLQKRMHGRRACKYMALFAAIIGLWCLSVSEFSLLLHPLAPVFQVAAFLLFKLSPVPLCLLAEERLRYILPGWFKLGTALLFSTDFLLSFLFRVFRTGTWYTETIFLTQAILLIISAGVVYFKLRNHRMFSRPVRMLEFTMSAILFVGLFTEGVLSLVLPGYRSGIAVGIATLFYVELLIILNVYHLIEHQRTSARRIRRLTAQRTAAMLSQLQPHFLYNSLSSIRALYRINPQRGEEGILLFSDFLRRNMESIEKGGAMASFSEELSRVQTYLALEKMRFGERVCSVYRIEVSEFRVPVLTVQLLVENAVRHGLTKKREGGTVTIRTYEDEENWYILVADDGAGCSGEALEGKGGTSGISNIRYRLKEYVGGTLTVQSEVGVGTEALCTLPKHRKRRIPGIS